MRFREPGFIIGIFGVGEVQAYDFDEESDSILIHVFIAPDHTNLVHANSRFWSAGGVQVKASLSGLDIRSESIGALIDGGIAFDLPPGVEPGGAVVGDIPYVLYSDFESAMERGVPITIEFTTNEGLEEGSPLKYRGLDIGMVTGIKINKGLKSVRVDVLLKPEAERIAVSGSRFWVVQPEVSLSGVSGLDTILTGNYLTVLPGRGRVKHRFKGLDAPPDGLVDVDPLQEGLELILEAERRSSVDVGSPVYYRQIISGRGDRF